MFRPPFFALSAARARQVRASASKRRQIQPSRPSERHAEKRDAVNQVDFHPLCSFSHNIQQDVSLRKGDGRSERRRQGARPAAWHRSGIDESLFKVPRNAFQNSESATGDQRKLMRAAFSRRTAALASPAARPPRRRTVKAAAVCPQTAAVTRPDLTSSWAVRWARTGTAAVPPSWACLRASAYA